MAAAESTEKLGQRVLIAKGKMESDLKNATQRFEYLKQNSPRTLATMIESVSDSFGTFSPFLESTLLIAWLHDAEKCKEIVLDACKKVLQAPIDATQYDWFKQYVFTSNIWMQKSAKSSKFMFEELLGIGDTMSLDIDGNMDSIFAHLKSHTQWKKVTAIQNKNLILRQDDPSVGLLRDKGLSGVFEMKSDDQKQSEDMKNFIDSNMAINMLTSTASKLNREFQQHMGPVMSAHGTYKAAPMKKVERSLSKVENDYKDALFPKAARLLDLIRCSVTFNTVEQLIAGVHAFQKHIKKNDFLELARVKNDFLRPEGGYRDIKVNVVFKSQKHPNVRMVCEVQMLLINYLEEKRKIHKLYSIVRDKTYFEMVVSRQKEKEPAKEVKDLQFEEKLDRLDVAKEVKDLQFKETLDVAKEVKLSYAAKEKTQILKCSVDSELRLLAMEGHDWFGVVDMESKKEVWKLDRKTNSDAMGGASGYNTHAWLAIGQQTYLSLQTGRNKIKMFKVVGKSEFIEDPKYELTYTSSKGDNATITFCEFDANFEHIYLVADNNVLQKRAVRDVNTVLQTIALKTSVIGSLFRNFRLSADGHYCVLGGGHDKSDFFVIDIANEKQIHLASKNLNSTYVPCFINGENKQIAVSDKNGKIEIWDVEKQESVKTLEVGKSSTDSWITSSASIHNILAIGSEDHTLRLYDVRNWKCFYSKTFQCTGWSLHLTNDLRYLTFAGREDKSGKTPCTVLQIQ